MSILGGLLGGMGPGNSAIAAAIVQHHIDSMYAEQRRRQIDYMQMQIYPGAIIECAGVTPVLMGVADKPSRRDCPNCGAPYRPVCDYCGS